MATRRTDINPAQENLRRSKIGKYSRNKGKDEERNLSHLFQKHGYNARRTQQFCGRSGDSSDVVGVPYIHVECKYRKSIGNIYEWMAQAVNDSMHKVERVLPVVFCRCAQSEFLVVMRFEDWMEMYQSYELTRTEDEHDISRETSD